MSYLSLRKDSTKFDDDDNGVKGVDVVDVVDGDDGVDGDDYDEDYEADYYYAYLLKVIMDGVHYTNLYHFYFWFILSDKVYYDEQ